MLKISIFGFLFFIFSIHTTLGTHLRGGQITFILLDCTTNTYAIVLTLYTNTNSPVMPGGGTLSFGDGGSTVVPSLTFVSSLDTTNAVGEVTYETKHTYSSQSGFLVSYTEENRDYGVLNMSNSNVTPLCLESYILIDGLCDPGIYFSVPPIDRACSGYEFTHNPGIIAPAGDSVSYQFVSPMATPNIPVSDYLYPNAPSLYAGNYQLSNETKNGPPTFQISQDGTLTWDAPGDIGEYAVDIKVFQWKLIDSVWINVSWVIRDMQILVFGCTITRPYLTLPPDICVHPGDQISQVIRGHQPDSDQVIITVFTVDDFNSSPPQILNANVLQSTSPGDTANIKINWLVSCDQVRPQPYEFILKISSTNSQGVRAFTFQTWHVKVLGQPPAYQSLHLDVSRKSLLLQWQPYTCTSGTTMEIYRRVDYDAGITNECQSGIPRAWGFQKIGSSSSNSFTDTHLAPGATYCYRLVAQFPSNQGVSIASRDTCIGPLIIDAPVITTVSVNQTDMKQGTLSVKWTSPFEINRSLFPPPYHYVVQRTRDSVNYFTLLPELVSDTSFVDSKLDVTDSTYGYRIIVYSPSSIAGNNPIDTSALAFYPRLSYRSLANGIALAWDASVPWSNQSTKFPYHYIYRKEIGSSKFLLMDSINIDTLSIPQGYSYTDYGAKPGFSIAPNTVYDYKIETQGGYGNPKIHEPLQNFSNEVLTQPTDKTAPCAPRISAQGISCDAFVQNSPCTVNDLKNTITWSYPSGCGNDVAYYKVFFGEPLTPDTVLIASTSDSSFVHHLQNSMAGCYRVLAIDRSGNVGTLSTQGCIENCTHVFLPNVITVNGDGKNESFPNLVDQSGKREPSKCSRFVKHFSMQIFNRWGSEVFSATGQPGESEWNGRDQKGAELPAGVYYFSANISFYSLKPESQNFVGWVALMR